MLLLLVLLQSTALTNSDTASVRCDSVSPAGEVPPSSVGQALAGEYHLTLVSTWEDLRGHQADGSLTLRHRPPAHSADSLTDAFYPPDVLYGATSVPLTRVKARTSRDQTSLDPDAPGVLLSGAIATISPCPRGMGCDDGQYTYLTITWVSTRGFGGWWSTDYGLLVSMRDGQRIPNPSGYFCATRR